MHGLSGNPLPVIEQRLKTAPTRSALIQVAQEIQHLPEHWQRERLGMTVKRRLAQFKKQ